MNNMPYEYDVVMYKTLPEALALVRSAVEGEREDELFYDYLISVAPSQEEIDIIKSIRDDERKHNKMFREIYAYFTGEQIQAEENPEFEKPKSYLEGIKKAFFGELAAVERYRNIRAGLPVNYYRDMVFEILTDELKHADKYNYILNMHHMHHENENGAEVTQADLRDFSLEDSRENDNRADYEYYTVETIYGVYKAAGRTRNKRRSSRSEHRAIASEIHPSRFYDWNGADNFASRKSNRKYG